MNLFPFLFFFLGIIFGDLFNEKTIFLLLRGMMVVVVVVRINDADDGGRCERKRRHLQVCDVMKFEGSKALVQFLRWQFVERREEKRKGKKKDDFRSLASSR